MKIEIRGPIVGDSEQWIYDWFGIPATSPSKVNKVIDKAIASQSSELQVVINSGGGSVFAASEIYTELRKFKGNVNVEVVGLAASAASVVAMAGTIVKMSPTASFMIHNASAIAQGDYREMDATSDLLQKVNKSIMSTYSAKTGKSDEELASMMNKETWLSAPEAKEAGFIDEIMFETEIDAVATADFPELVNGMLPKEVIDKMRIQLANEAGASILNSTNPEPIDKGAKNKMDLETLRNEHPDLVNQIVEEAVANERRRIQDIENIAVPGSEEIINKAKFESGISAADTAMEILKNEKTKKTTLLNNIKQDAEPLNEIESGASPQKNENVDSFVDNILGNLGLKGVK
ncbi:phage protein [Bacillus sp. OxB-1]|nr:phage protein [Bacillus sp. OxB-1]